MSLLKNHNSGCSGYLFSQATHASRLSQGLTTPAATTWTITVTQGANGTISPGTTAVSEGSNQAFTFTPASGYSLKSATVDGSTVAVASPWTDLGTQGTDTKIRSIAYDSVNNIAIACGDQVHRSTDYGATWSTITMPSSATYLKVLYAGNNTFLIGATSGKIYISTDLGLTWTDLGTQYSQTHVYALTNIGGGVVLAGAQPGGLILRSTNYGASWTNTGQMGSETKIYALEYLGGGIVLAGFGSIDGVLPGNIWRSITSGETIGEWADVNLDTGGELDFDFITHLGGGYVIASSYPNSHLFR